MKVTLTFSLKIIPFIEKDPFHLGQFFILSQRIYSYYVLPKLSFQNLDLEIEKVGYFLELAVDLHTCKMIRMFNVQ